MSGLVIHEAGYICHCVGSAVREGCWVPSILFELASEADKPLARAVRYRYPEMQYSTEKDATNAAVQLALKKAQAGDVDFSR